MAHRIPAARADADAAPVFVHRGFAVAHGERRQTRCTPVRPAPGVRIDA
jgi:hypothetical protein